MAASIKNLMSYNDNAIKTTASLRDRQWGIRPLSQEARRWTSETWHKHVPAASNEASTKAALLSLAPGCLDGFHFTEAGIISDDPLQINRAHVLADVMHLALELGMLGRDANLKRRVEALAPLCVNYGLSTYKAQDSSDAAREQERIYVVWLLTFWLFNDLLDDNKDILNRGVLDGIENLFRLAWERGALFEGTTYDAPVFCDLRTALQKISLPAALHERMRETVPVLCKLLHHCRVSLADLGFHDLELQFFTDSMFEHIFSFRDKNDTEPHRMDFESFRELRLKTSGMDACYYLAFLFTARDCGVDIIEYLSEHRDAIQSIMHYANAHAGFVNDVFSLHKDLLIGKKGQANIVLVHQARLSMGDVLDAPSYFRACELAVKQIKVEFSKWNRSSPSLGDCKAARIVRDVLEQMTWGNFLFHLQELRYVEGIALARALLSTQPREVRHKEWEETFQRTCVPALLQVRCGVPA